MPDVNTATTAIIVTAITPKSLQDRRALNWGLTMWDALFEA